MSWRLSLEIEVNGNRNGESARQGMARRMEEIVLLLKQGWISGAFDLDPSHCTTGSFCLVRKEDE